MKVKAVVFIMRANNKKMNKWFNNRNKKIKNSNGLVTQSRMIWNNPLVIKMKKRKVMSKVKMKKIMRSLI